VGQHISNLMATAAAAAAVTQDFTQQTDGLLELTPKGVKHNIPTQDTRAQDVCRQTG
jgi:hypothetical protein